MPKRNLKSRGFTLISAGRFSPEPSKRSSDINSKPQSGFTLIELMVAVVIVAILASVGLFTYSQAQVYARDSKRKSDLQSIRTALELYYQRNGNSYPNPNSPGDYCDKVSNLQSSLQNYINSIPSDPNNSTDDYYYILFSSSGTYGLYAALENTSDPAAQSGIQASDISSNSLSCTSDNKYNYKVSPP